MKHQIINIVDLKKEKKIISKKCAFAYLNVAVLIIFKCIIDDTSIETDHQTWASSLTNFLISFQENKNSKLNAVYSLKLEEIVYFVKEIMSYISKQNKEDHSKSSYEIVRFTKLSWFLRFVLFIHQSPMGVSKIKFKSHFHNNIWKDDSDYTHLFNFFDIYFRLRLWVQLLLNPNNRTRF